MRPIDADALKENVIQGYNDTLSALHEPWAMALAHGMTFAFVANIYNAPTVDAVPVVRCSECEYNNACFTQSFVESEGVLPFDRDTWYCADGKRKGGDE